MSHSSAVTTIDQFLKPLALDNAVALKLSREFYSNFKHLCTESLSQFLPTPISMSILRPVGRQNTGRFLAMDMYDTPTVGGSNLRVGFVELLSEGQDRRLNRLLEQSWPILDHLKHENSEHLFGWVGEHIAQVVRKGCETWGLSSDEELPMGVTFSFPMKQTSLSEATLMAMGKGFAITSDLDLGGHLVKGYEQHRTAGLPPIKIAAITNDAVATLVSFVYQYPAAPNQKAAMGLIVGTGCNATIPLQFSKLHKNKFPDLISVQQDYDLLDVGIAVNTEWSINGSASPLRMLGLISRWDDELDKACEAPGFQPLEYMTAGRYLGELARLIFVDFLTTVQGVPPEDLPQGLHQRFGLSTTFLSHFYPDSDKGDILEQLQKEFELSTDSTFTWTSDHADTLYHIAKVIQTRAAGIVAAATIGLLRCADELPDPSEPVRVGVANGDNVEELVVGYTGGCIQHFQDYLKDTQAFLDFITQEEFAAQGKRIRVKLEPCHDGGITGAGILVPAALASTQA
ncbi:actin-like ATPase domain-containing protein [Neurospora hispaniola]|uniref:Phosphotransferase n=1 Tax=Neurospora hispaniola TaxID=588809 RepID=A0AAJ0I031_9PEZI|nr:actin-like ATPase domain-containing protein [Neurospora hispaniola]